MRVTSDQVAAARALRDLLAPGDVPSAVAKIADADTSVRPPPPGALVVEVVRGDVETSSGTGFRADDDADQHRFRNEVRVPVIYDGEIHYVWKPKSALFTIESPPEAETTLRPAPPLIDLRERDRSDAWDRSDPT